MGPACPQQAINLPLPESLPANVTDFLINTAFGAIFPDDEDCGHHLYNLSRLLNKLNLSLIIRFDYQCCAASWHCIRRKFTSRSSACP